MALYNNTQSALTAFKNFSKKLRKRLVKSDFNVIL